MRKGLLVALTAVFFFSLLGVGNCKPIKLVFTHFEPPSGGGGIHAKKFCEELVKRTGGRIKAVPAIACSLGPATEQFAMVDSGIADMGGFIPQYTPGRFPLLQLTDLPISTMETATVTEALMELKDKGYFDKEIGDNSKLLWVVMVPGIEFMFAKKKIDTIDGMKGIKIKTSGEFWPKVAGRLGMVSVQMPITDTYAALEKGVVDGIMTTYGVLDAFKLVEVIKYIAEVNLTYTIFAYVINKKFYNNLPADIRKIVDDLAKEISVMESEYDEGMARDGKALFLKSGGEVYTLPKSQWQKIEAIVRPLWDQRVNEVEAKGYPAKKMLNELQSILESKGIKDPFVR